MGAYDKLKQEAYEANMEIPRQDLAIFTWGNASAFDWDREVCAIKPSGVAYDELSPEHMVVLKLDGTAAEGAMRPSSDTATHLVMYRYFGRESGIRGICHTHSPYAVSWAQAKKPVPIFGTTHADHYYKQIPVTEELTDEAIQGDYEIETGNVIVDALKSADPKELEMILVAGHGPFTWGSDAKKAVYNSRVLEEIALMAMNTLIINPEASQLKQSLRDKHYQRKHGKNAYYGQN